MHGAWGQVRHQRQQYIFETYPPPRNDIFDMFKRAVQIYLEFFTWSCLHAVSILTGLDCSTHLGRPILGLAGTCMDISQSVTQNAYNDNVAIGNIDMGEVGEVGRRGSKDMGEKMRSLHNVYTCYR